MLVQDLFESSGSVLKLDAKTKIDLSGIPKDDAKKLMKDKKILGRYTFTYKHAKPANDWVWKSSSHLPPEAATFQRACEEAVKAFKKSHMTSYVDLELTDAKIRNAE